MATRPDIILSSGAIIGRVEELIAPARGEIKLNTGHDVRVNGIHFKRAQDKAVLKAPGGSDHEYFLSIIKAGGNGLVLAREITYLTHPREAFEDQEGIALFTHALNGVNPEGKMVSAQVTTWTVHNPSPTGSERFYTFHVKDGISSDISGLIEQMPELYSREKQQSLAILLGILPRA